MRDLSIEYAHIYTNKKIDEEHKLSLQILEDLKKQEDLSSHSISLVLMVDDYSFPDPTFDYAELTTWLTQEGFKPDVTFRESQLIALCDDVLKLIKDESIRVPIEEYIKAKKKYPCSLFIAAWYLLRLGHISFGLFDSQFVAKKLINILPLSFKPFEDKALEIIASTPFAEAVQNVDYKYFEGRLVA